MMNEECFAHRSPECLGRRWENAKPLKGPGMLSVAGRRMGYFTTDFIQFMSFSASSSLY